MFDDALRERLASGADVALAAVDEFAGHGVGEHLGTVVEADFTTTHRFAADLPGYRGWYWACVLALVPGGELTVDEIALLPGDEALVAPEWVPWDQRVRAGDLGAGDLLPPDDDDPRLVPGHTLTGDDRLDELTGPIGLGREQHLSPEGRAMAAERWMAERGPDSEVARAAKNQCFSCGFLLPMDGLLSRVFGVCANEFSADGQVVHMQYGCGAHSAVERPKDTGPATPEAFDDAAVDVIVLPQQLRAAAKAREEAEAAEKSEAEAAEAAKPEQAEAAATASTPETADADADAAPEPAQAEAESAADSESDATPDA